MIGGTAQTGLSTSIDIGPPMEPWGRASASSIIVQPAPPVRTLFVGIPGLSDFGAQVAGPIPVAAPWLPDVFRRIRDSVVPDGRQFDNEGQWLTSEIAIAATAFFQLTSDVLPGEPHIYSSLRGDLVAEFGGPHGVMNAVISPTRFIALVVVGDKATEKRIDWNSIKADTLRKELQEITLMLCDGEYGSKMGA
jgi:hypothetical protein